MFSKKIAYGGGGVGGCDHLTPEMPVLPWSLRYLGMEHKDSSHDKDSTTKRSQQGEHNKDGIEKDSTEKDGTNENSAIVIERNGAWSPKQVSCGQMSETSYKSVFLSNLGKHVLTVPL